MSIYTKTGDKGKTGIFGGTRIWKHELQIEAYGKVDEASSFIGLAFEAIDKKEIRDFLTIIQEDLYKIMAYLSAAPVDLSYLKHQVSKIEKQIDDYEKTLPPLTRFILPQGSEQASRLHVARAVVRTAERRIVDYLSSKSEEKYRDLIIAYCNRLSDLLFIYARLFTPREKRT
jgi:cob(I)alamin adenosyltransferase